MIKRYLCQSTVHASHGFVVQTFRTVHHNDIIAKCFSKILDSLSFACTSRSLWTAAPMKVKCCCQCHVTSVQRKQENKFRKNVKPKESKCHVDKIVWQAKWMQTSYKDDHVTNWNSVNLYYFDRKLWEMTKECHAYLVEGDKEECIIANLSVRGVITSRPEFPKYSYPYWNWVFVCRTTQSSMS